MNFYAVSEQDDELQEDSTLKLIENAEIIEESGNISANIGIIGGPRKKNPIEKSDDLSLKEKEEDHFSKPHAFLETKSPNTQYYDPFSKYSGPPKTEKAENLWHYSLFPNISAKRGNPPGLGLFQTNRENKYSLFSNEFLYKSRETEENEEKDANLTSFEEKSDSEFSEKSSFLQNKLNKPAETRENEQFLEDVREKNSKTFNFPQSNNPFSLSQLILRETPENFAKNSGFFFKYE